MCAAAFDSNGRQYMLVKNYLKNLRHCDARMILVIETQFVFYIGLARLELQL